MTVAETGGLKSLGAGSTAYATAYDPGLLEAFPNFAAGEHWVHLNCNTFSSVCPITSQPDWGRFVIRYVPDASMVESKSLKLYLGSFRNHGAFHEECTYTIAQDLIQLLDPKFLDVQGYFVPRGDISIDPYVAWGKPGTRWERVARHVLERRALTKDKGRRG